MQNRKKLYTLIFITTIVRLLIAASIDLGNDEVYYWTYAQHLQWNYFDHPPMVGLLIKMTTLNLLLKSAFFVRLSAICFAATSTWLIYKIVVNIKNEEAGYFAALLYTASIYGSIIAGIFILPDSPQLFFWLLSIYFLLHFLKHKESVYLLFFGAAVGICTMCKVHGLFLCFGFGLYIVFFERKLLRNPYLYLAIGITTIIISPIFIWNMQNDFITYRFHSQRVVPNQGLQFESFLQEFIGQILYANPIIYFLLLLLIAQLKKRVINQPVQKILLCLSLPLIILMLLLSLLRDTLPHWSGPGYISLIILAAIHFAEQAKKNLYTKLAVFANVLVVFVGIAGIVLIQFYPGTIGSQKKENKGDGDFTLDMYGWQKIAIAFDSVYQKDLKAGLLAKNHFLIANKWFPSAHIDFYVAQKTKIPFVAIGQLDDIHHYAWLNKLRKQIQNSDDAYFITSSNYFTDPVPLYKNVFRTIDKPVVIEQMRNGETARLFFIYRLRHFQDSLITQKIGAPSLYKIDRKRN